MRHLEHGIIETDQASSHGERLLQIEQQLQAIIDRHSIRHCVLEEVFFRKNLTTGVMLIQARGVVILNLVRNRIDYTEISPTALKKALTGSGTSNKKQMQSITARLLGLKEVPQPDDAADALGLAICAGFRERNRSILKNSGATSRPRLKTIKKGGSQ